MASIQSYSDDDDSEKYVHFPPTSYLYLFWMFRHLQLGKPRCMLKKNLETAYFIKENYKRVNFEILKIAEHKFIHVFSYEHILMNRYSCSWKVKP